MSQIVTATFQDGVLKPERELALTPGTRVRLIIEAWDEVLAGAQAASDELDQLCDEFPIDSRSKRLTRDELHERG
jgi:predicted DNA-binding antitoxin AbrB/MazE fold protein